MSIFLLDLFITIDCVKNILLLLPENISKDCMQYCSYVIVVIITITVFILIIIRQSSFMAAEEINMQIIFFTSSVIDTGVYGLVFGHTFQTVAMLI